MARKAQKPGTKPRPPGRRTQTDPNALTELQEAFICEYHHNGGNGTRAYLAVAPHVKVSTAATEACAWLREPKIREKIDAARAERWQRLQMGQDEAMSLLAGDARLDPRELFDEKGDVLPVHLWPDHIARSVASIKHGPYGLSIKFNNSQAARVKIAEQLGAIKSVAGSLDALAEAIKADKEKHGPKPPAEPEGKS